MSQNANELSATPAQRLRMIRAPKRTDPAATHLDALRGIAASLVVIGHARNLLITDAQGQGHLSPWVKVFFFLTSLGRDSVLVFFVLSGFFISSSILAAFKADRWSWTQYAIARLTRLYTVLVPALIFGFILDSIGLAYFGHTTPYTVPDFGHVLPPGLASRLTPLVAAGNMLFLQTIRVPWLGSNGPLWSLANEFWYYVIFPLFAVAVLSVGKSVWIRVASAILGVGLIFFVGPDIAKYGLVWLMGVGVVLAPPVRVPTLGTFAAFGLVLLLLVAKHVAKVPLFPSELALGLATALACYCVLNQPKKEVGSLYAKLAQSSAAVSYSLYLVHVPLIVLFSAAVLGTGPRLEARGGGLGIFLGGILAAFLYAAAVWWLFESRTDKIRAWFMSRLERPTEANSPQRG